MIENPTIEKFFYNVTKDIGLPFYQQPEAKATHLLYNIRPGRLLSVAITPTTIVERGGWRWLQYHEKRRNGWVQERALDNSEIRLLSQDDLPVQNQLFESLPLPIDDIHNVYYYGNTRFAFCCGDEHSYDEYSQGLHGGLDFGNRNGIVLAGVHGEFVESSTASFDPMHVKVKTDDGYCVLYGHLSEVNDELENNRVVNPDTVIGVVDANRAHLHLEVRYLDETFIVNPLLLMPPNMRDAIINKFDHIGVREFFSGWNEWQSPLDQPIIRRGGWVIGRKFNIRIGTNNARFFRNQANCLALDC